MIEAGSNTDDSPERMHERRYGLAAGSLDDVFASNGIDRYTCERAAVSIPRGAAMLLRGWAANPTATGPARALHVFIDGERRTAHYGEERADVELVHGRSALRPTGFHIVVATTDLAAGSHVLRILTDEGDGDIREFEPLVFEVADASSPSPFRTSTRGLFDIEIERFHAANRPPGIDERFERRFVGVVAGRVRERATRRPASALFAVIDGFHGAHGQLGYRSASGEPDGFVLCFPTDFAYGEHEIALVATSAAGEVERVSELTFSIAPICCGPAVPVDTRGVVEAHVEWTSPDCSGAFARSDMGFVRGWALDPADRDSAAAAYLEFEDGRSVALRMRQLRDDLAIENGADGTRFCGFVGSIAFAHFAPGLHTGTVVIETKDRARRYRTAAAIAFEVG